MAVLTATPIGTKGGDTPRGRCVRLSRLGPAATSACGARSGNYTLLAGFRPSEPRPYRCLRVSRNETKRAARR
jgi:hypothetical protein